MEFVGYSSKEMLNVEETIYIYKENYVINDNGNLLLAIKMPKCNMVETYALFAWNEFANSSDEERNEAIGLKAEEAIRYFQETTAVIYGFLPRLICHDVMTILKLDCGSVGRCPNHTDTTILLNENGISLEHDFRRNIWLVNISNIVSFSLNNKNSAERIYQLVSKDISNYINFRGGRP